MLLEIAVNAMPCEATPKASSLLELSRAVWTHCRCLDTDLTGAGVVPGEQSVGVTATTIP